MFFSLTGSAAALLLSLFFAYLTWIFYTYKYLTPVGLSALGSDLFISSLNPVQSERDVLHAGLLHVICLPCVMQSGRALKKNPPDDFIREILQVWSLKEVGF